MARGIDRPIAPRELVALAFTCLHPAAESLMVDSRNTNTFPEMVLWPVRSATGALDGLLVRTFSVHPVLLDPVRRSELPRATADGHHLMRTGLKLEQCHVVEDSDEVAIFEVTPAHRVIGNRTAGGGVSLPRCDRYQASHWQRSIRLHAGDLDERWTRAQAESVALLRRLQRLQPYGPTLFQTYRLLHILRQRQDAWVRAARRTLRGRVTAKQVLRPAKVQLHRVAKASRLRMKRVRRFMRVFRAA